MARASPESLYSPRSRRVVSRRSRRFSFFWRFRSFFILVLGTAALKRCRKRAIWILFSFSFVIDVCTAARISNSTALGLFRIQYGVYNMLLSYECRVCVYRSTMETREKPDFKMNYPSYLRISPVSILIKGTTVLGVKSAPAVKVKSDWLSVLLS